MDIPDWLLQVLIGFASSGFFVFVIEGWWKWRNRPKIEIEFDTNSGCVALTPVGSASSNKLSVYVRVRVVNTGRSAAKSARLFISEFYSKDGEGIEYFDRHLDPIDMHWSLETKKESEDGSVDIPAYFRRYGDVASQELYGGIMKIMGRHVPFRLEVRVNDASLIRLKLVVAGDNFVPASINLELTPGEGERWICAKTPLSWVFRSHGHRISIQ